MFGPAVAQLGKLIEDAIVELVAAEGIGDFAGGHGAKVVKSGRRLLSAFGILPQLGSSEHEVEGKVHVQ